MSPTKKPKNRVPVHGSEREPLAGAHFVGPVDPNERIQVTISVRRRRTSPGLSPMVTELGARPVHERKYLSREEFAATHGADPADLEKMEEFAHEHGLDVVDVNAAQRRVVLSGTAAALCTAFGVSLATYEHPGGTYRGCVGYVQVPEDLAPIIQAVMGLDNRPQAQPHFRLFSNRDGTVRPLAGGGITYTPPQLAQLYNFPAGADGSGQCIAIIELGGGYRLTDLKKYFHQLEIPLPKISNRSVDGGHNKPSTPDSADGEVMLDIEVAGAVAPGAKIVVYFAPNTDAGFYDAITSAVHDTVNKPSVISISWGSAESQWTSQAMQAMDQAFQDAAAMGVTVCVAAGDNGSTDGLTDGLLHADFPASSSFVLGCGGTRLEGSGKTITNEVVWNEGQGGGATGGGISDVFDLPTWQASANVQPSQNPGGRIGRGVPDVAGDADPATGYQVLVDGQQLVIGGTSAVAPLWAGLIALINQKLAQPVGYLNPVLYSLPSGSAAFGDITVGNNDISGQNGPYQAGTGWDACTGWGSPNGANLLKALSRG